MVWRLAVPYELVIDTLYTHTRTKEEQQSQTESCGLCIPCLGTPEAPGDSFEYASTFSPSAGHSPTAIIGPCCPALEPFLYFR